MKNRTRIPLFVLSLLLIVLATVGCGAKDVVSSAASAASSSDASTAAPGMTEASDDAFSHSEAIDDNGFWKNVDALKSVELCDYKKITIPKSVHEITDAMVQTEIDGILESHVTTEPITDRAVVDGDTVNIDFVGTVDGVEFEGGSTSGAGTEVTIGVTSYIDDFLQQLIGHKPGDSFDVNVTFPENYGVDNLNGKDAVFATTINHIVNQVKPELTEEFVAANLTEPYGWKTIEEMKSTIRSDMQTTAIDRFLREYVLDNSKVLSLPSEIVDHQTAIMIDYYKGYAQYYGVSYEEFLSMYAGVMNEDQLIESNKDTNVEASSLYLFIQAIAEDAKISVGESDVAAYFKDKMGLDDYSDYEKQYGMPYLKLMVLNDSVLQHLKENAVME
jgi:trigger factor